MHLAGVSGRLLFGVALCYFAELLLAGGDEGIDGHLSQFVEMSLYHGSDQTGAGRMIGMGTTGRLLDDFVDTAKRCNFGS